MLERMPGAQADLVLPHVQELRRLSVYVSDEDDLGPQGVFARNQQRPLACCHITGLKLPTVCASGFTMHLHPRGCRSTVPYTPGAS